MKSGQSDRSTIFFITLSGKIDDTSQTLLYDLDYWMQVVECPLQIKTDMAFSFHKIPVMRQTWSNIVWCHWPVDPQQVKAVIPEGLEPDLFEGKAWVGLIPFSMQNLRLPGPFTILSKLVKVSNFGEVNVRTYVKDSKGRTGVWFCTLDSDDWLAVKTANVAFGLPYRLSKTRLERTASTIKWFNQRKGDQAKAELEVTTRDEPWRAAAPGLEQFLVERYSLYTLRRGKLLRGTLSHEKWSVRSAELESLNDETVHVAGFETSDKPHILVGADVEVTVYPLARV